jgi:ribose 5-phosphate isomerase B
MEENKTILIGCDHAGFEVKDMIVEFLKSKNLEVKDFGTHSANSVDYPDFVHPLAKEMKEKPELRGILICGSGNGVAMTANKYTYIRAALCWNKELAELARLHNDANILCVPARFVSRETIIEMVDAFLATSFEGGRHANRVNKISNC